MLENKIHLARGLFCALIAGLDFYMGYDKLGYCMSTVAAISIIVYLKGIK